MDKRVFWCLFVVAFSMVLGRPVHAQNRGTVTGTVVESQTGTTIPSATVALHSVSDSSLVTGTVTDGDGVFRIEGIAPGQYYLRVSFVGYVPKIIPDVAIRPGQQEVTLGEIALARDVENLDEVTVAAERAFREVALDKTIYHPQNQPLTAGGSAMDVLRLIPSVQIDLTGSISLRGNEGVVIYINGNPAPMSGQALTNFLNSLSSEAIERVEIITNPSASYAPEGMAGIINIVLAKGEDIGFGGGVSARLNTQGQYGGSVSVHYGSGPWSFYGNYGLRYGRDESSGTRYRENLYLDPMTVLDQNEQSERQGLSQYLHSTIEYRLSDKNSLSLSALLSRRGGQGEQLTAYALSAADGSLISRYNRRSTGENTDLDMEAGFTFQRIIVPQEHEVEVEVEVEREVEDEASSYAVETLAGEELPGDLTGERQRSNQQEYSTEVDLDADYERPLGEDGRLEVGYRGEFERLETRFHAEYFDPEAGAYIPVDDLNSAFVYDQMTHAVFGLVGYDFGAFGAQGGLRLEQALTDFNPGAASESFGNSYFSFFPSAHLSYQPIRPLTFRLSYSKRVNRPNTWQLNPIDDLDDPTHRRIGNPDLEPEYTHSFEVSGNYLGNGYSLTLSSYYRHTFNAIAWRQYLNDDGVSVTTFANYATRNSYGFEAVGSLDWRDRLHATVSLNAYQRVTDGSNVQTELSSNAFGYRTRARIRYSVFPNLTVQLSQSYRSPLEVPGGRIGAFTSTSAGLRWQLLDGRASVSLRARDLFNTLGFTSVRESDRYYQVSSHDWNAGGFRLSLRYTFGAQDDERSRGGGGPEEGAGGGSRGWQ